VNNILVGKKRKGRDLLENQVIDERVILEWILEKQGGKVWTGCVCLRVRNTVMSPQVPKKAGNFLTSRVTINFSRRTLVLGVMLHLSSCYLCVVMFFHRGQYLKCELYLFITKECVRFEEIDLSDRLVTAPFVFSHQADSGSTSECSM
jgi:hypothetical protein